MGNPIYSCETDSLYRKALNSEEKKEIMGL